MDEKVEINVKDLAQAVVKRIWIVILCTVLAAAISLVYTKNFVTPTYKASVTMYVNNNSNTTGMTSSDLAVALQLAKTYVNIIQSDAVLDRVVEETGLNLTSKQIRQMLSASVVDETEMFRVSIISPNARMSSDIVNAIASIAPSEISRIIEGSSAKVVDYAKEPTERYAPNYTMNTVLGGLIGGLFVVAVIIICKVSDKRVQTEEDLMSICKVPVLGAIPDFTETVKQAERDAENRERRRA